MNTVTTKDGVQIFYKDWGKGQPIVFHHGWPLSCDDWDTQMLFFVQHGYRVIGIDRRGHGRSSQVSDGHDMDHYAADAAAVTEHLDLRNAVHIGHSTGGGEVTRYVARHGKGRVGASAPAHHLPGICLIGEEVPSGFLISYGQDFPDFFRRAAAYVDKILKGAKPADLPVEQPTRFKLVINLKVAKALGVSIPQTLLTTADEVIE
jgi:non-heme chloroperoxidase